MAATLSRREAALALGALTLGGCVTPRAAAKTFRVATFNIWHDAGDWPKRLPLLVAALRETDADVIALQEVLQDSAKDLPNQAATIAAALNGYSVHFSSADPVGAAKRYGNAILSRHAVADEAMVALEPLDDYRTALRVRIAPDGRPIDVVSIHLAWQPEASVIRARQLRHLFDWLPKDETPIVVMGDFNAELSDAALTLMDASFMRAPLPASATTTLGPPAGAALKVIDHIFADRAHFGTEAARIIGDRPVDGIYPSDHFGVAATVTLR